MCFLPLQVEEITNLIRSLKFMLIIQITDIIHFFIYEKRFLILFRFNDYHDEHGCFLLKLEVDLTILEELYEEQN